MRFVKIFKSIENELWTMEKEINEWVKETGNQIVSVTGNIAPQTGAGTGSAFAASDILIVVVYESVE